MPAQISGNCVAQNTRITMHQFFPSGQGDNIIQRVYSDANGNYTFSNVSVGTFQLVFDLNECSVAPYNTGYRYLTNLIVTMDAALDSLTNVNISPTLIIAPQGSNNQDHSNNLGRNYIVPRG
jgi:hypothetical protein